VLANTKISSRLALSFGVVILLFVGTGLLNIAHMRSLNQNVDVIVTDMFPKTTLFNQLIKNLDTLEITARNVLIYDDEKASAEALASIVRLQEKNERDLEYVDGILSPKGRELNAILRSKDKKYSASLNQFMQFISVGNKPEAARLLLGRLGTERQDYGDGLRQMLGIGEGLLKKTGKDIEMQYRNSIVITTALTLSAITLAVACGIWVTRSITRPLNQAVEIAGTVASGDLSSRIVVARSDETGRLLTALNSMNASLVTIVEQVRARTETIRVATTEIAAGNHDLSNRTEQQAGSLEETASAMEQLTVTVKKNTENAQQARQLAISTSGVAAKGGTAVGDVIDTMRSIDDSSKKIANIIGVIDGIAFQTNILALNAAVEAARAGEHGRGFAVVASEVRNLAQRSATAAKEIKQLIGDSVKKVDDGTRLVEQAGDTMREMVASVRRLTTIVEEISTASAEQSIGIGEVNQAIAQMEQTTQQNAALVEQAAAAAQSLHDQTTGLSEIVSTFRLAGHHSAADIPLTIDMT
jgi:methyl-accepting chemotaxis protein